MKTGIVSRLLPRIRTVLSHRSNYGGRRAAKDIKYIAVHYTANDGDTDEGNGNYFHNNALKPAASAHYFVDDDSITQSVPDLNIAWSVGGSQLNDIRQTGGASMYGKITNANSISIEMCDTVRNGRYDFTEATIENTILLCVMLMLKYDISINNVYRHFDVTGKHCPGVTGWWGKNSSEWLQFKERVFIMEGKEMYEAIQKYLGTQTISAKSQAELDEAKALGITDGSNPMQLANRWQVAAMVKRAIKK